MPQVWFSFLLRLTMLLLAGVVIGWLYDAPLAGLVAALLLALLWQLMWLYRLERWLHGERMQNLPEGSGVWSQVFANINFQRVRNKRRRKEFKKLLKEMRRATRSFPDGGIILNSDNDIVTLNGVAEKLLGLKKKQDRGLRIETLIRDPDFVAYLHDNDFSAAVEIRSPLSHEQWLSCHQVPYGPEQKLLLIRDITQQRRADEMRRDFVANASHELRTPLTVISGYLEMLADDDSLAAELKMPVAEMQLQSGRMRTLVEELLHLSEIESKGMAAKTSPVNIRSIMETALKEANAQPDCPQEIKLLVDSDADLLGDPQDIQSVVSNLVSNAVRYTPREGSIVVAWTHDADGACLSVKDSGPGIAPAHIPRLTERFYRVEGGRERKAGDAGGTGLGLAIVKHALQRHSATLQINSKPGAGSEFICRFPTDRVAQLA